MTPQEQQMIDGLISRIRNTQVPTKDSEAEQHIQGGLAGFPDALYVLVQTVLVQQYGLEQAQSQLGELKQQNKMLGDKLEQAAAQAKSTGAGGSFLSHIFGGGSNQSAPPSPQTPAQAQYQPVNNPGYSNSYPAGGYPPPPPVYPPQGYPAPSQSYPAPMGGGGLFGGGGSGGFLQGALQTAAGVAAGEMVFQGMEDLFHGFGGHERGFGGGFGGGMGGGETVVNNYYDDDRGGGRESGGRDFANQGDQGDRGDRDAGFYNPGSDASRENFGDTTQGAADTGGFGGNAMDFGSNDASSGDSSFDDSASFDSGGSDDSSSSGDDN